MFKASYDDLSIRLFEEQTGIQVPVDKSDSKRYGKRYDWLMQNAKDKWIEWRCAKVNESWLAIKEAVNREGFDCYRLNSGARPAFILQEAVLRDQIPVRDMLKAGSFEPSPLRNLPGFAGGFNLRSSEGRGGFMANTWNYLPDGATFTFNTDKDVRAAVDFGDNNTIAMIYNQFKEPRDGVRPTSEMLEPLLLEAEKNLPESAAKVYKPFLWRELGFGQGEFTRPCSAPWPGGDNFAQDFVYACAFASVPLMIQTHWMDMAMQEVHHQSMRRFAAAYLSLPLAKYETLTGNGLDKGVIVRAGQSDSKPCFFVINPTWGEQNTALRCADKTVVTDLVTDVPATTAANGSLGLGLKPYDMKVYRVDGGALPTAASTTPSPAATAECKRRLANAEKILALWGSAAEINARAVAVRKEIDATRRALAEGDLWLAIRHIDGYALRSPLAMLVHPPITAHIAEPAAGAGTRLLLRFDGSTPTDESMEKREITGECKYASGRHGNGATGGLTVKGDGLFNLDQSFTVDFWVKFDNDQFDEAKGWGFKFLQRGTFSVSLTGSGFWGLKHYLPRLDVRIEDGRGVTHTLRAQAPLTAGVWHHVAVVWDKEGARENFRLYISGRLQDRNSVKKVLPVKEENIPLAILPSAASLVVMDELRVTSKALTLQEIGFPADWDAAPLYDLLRN